MRMMKGSIYKSKNRRLIDFQTTSVKEENPINPTRTPMTFIIDDLDDSAELSNEVEVVEPPPEVEVFDVEDPFPILTALYSTPFICAATSVIHSTTSTISLLRSSLYREKVGEN